MSLGANQLQARLREGSVVDLRGDGKAGGGLVLVVQAFGSALAVRGDLDVQDWPLFSSARKGANVRAYLRLATKPIERSCQVTAPDIAILMNEAAAKEVDFAEGTDGGIYVINTTASPRAAADRYRLGGVVATIAGDDLGARFLGRPLGNISVFAALVRVTELVAPKLGRESLEHNLEKRRIPKRLIDANLALFDASLEEVKIEARPAGGGTDHRRPCATAAAKLPAGAQSGLRTSRQNLTSGYGRPGVSTEFRDPETKCNGCSLCVAVCPEGIIQFKADPEKGALVYGARFAEFCKVCRECVAACPLDLFKEVESVARPIAVPEGA